MLTPRTSTIVITSHPLKAGRSTNIVVADDQEACQWLLTARTYVKKIVVGAELITLELQKILNLFPDSRITIVDWAEGLVPAFYSPENAKRFGVVSEDTHQILRWLSGQTVVIYLPSGTKLL